MAGWAAVTKRAHAVLSAGRGGAGRPEVRVCAGPEAQIPASEAGVGVHRRPVGFRERVATSAESAASYTFLAQRHAGALPRLFDVAPAGLLLPR